MGLCTARGAGIALAAVGFFLWGDKTQPIKNREMGGAVALGGRRLMMTNNNQLTVGRIYKGGVRAEARWAGSAWGDLVSSFGASNWATKNI